MGTIEKLASADISTQPVLGFDWNASKEGLCVLGTLDQSIHVALVSKLNTE